MPDRRAGDLRGGIGSRSEPNGAPPPQGWLADLGNVLGIPAGALYWTYAWLHIALGWVLTSFIVAALSGLIKKDQPMPDFPIIDAHVHLYDPGRIRYGWMRGTGLESPHLPAEFDAARGTIEVEGIVWIEVGADPGQHEQEASLVAGLATADPRIRGMVAAAPLEHGDAVKAALEKLAALPRLKGVRRLLQGEADHEFCLRPGFIQGVKLLPGFGLSFDLCVYHHQLYNVVELVRRCPEVPFILDHIGKPAIRKGRLDPWRTDVERLAALPNVWCKLSGVVTEANHAAWTREQLRPYIRHAAEQFGFDRLVFGSDWPVSKLTHRYADWVEIVTWALADCSADERRKLFRDNAIAFYRLEDTTGR